MPQAEAYDEHAEPASVRRIPPVELPRELGITHIDTTYSIYGVPAPSAYL